MSKETIQTYLLQQLNDFCPSDWALTSMPDQHALIVTIRLKAKKAQQTYVFEDSFLIYDKKRSQLASACYTMVLDFDSTLGCQKGLLDIFLKQMRRVLQQGKVQFQEHVQTDASQPFALQWQQADFWQEVMYSQQIQRYDTYYIPYDENGA